MHSPVILFERLRTGLDEGIRYARGRQALRKTVLVGPPPRLRGGDVTRLRRRLRLSQRELAQTLNVSIKTVQSWEHGNRRPSQAALRLLQMLQLRPDVFVASLA